LIRGNVVAVRCEGQSRLAQPSITIVNPAADAPGYHTAEFAAHWGLPNHVSVADLTSVTVAAMVPPGWKVLVIDNGIDPVDFTDVPVLNVYFSRQ